MADDTKNPKSQQPKDDRDEVVAHPGIIAANPNSPNYLHAIASHIMIQPVPKTSDEKGPGGEPGTVDMSKLAPNSGPAPLPLSAMPQKRPAVVNLMDRIRQQPHHGFAGNLMHGLKEVGAGALMGSEALGEAMFPTIAANIPGSMTRTNLENARNMATAEQDTKNRIEQEKADNPPEVAAIRAQQAADTEKSREAAASDKQLSDQQFKERLQGERDQFLNDMEQKKLAATPFNEWVANPAVYDAFLKAEANARQQQRGSIMSPYAAVRLADYAYRFDPRLLPFAQGAMEAVAKQIGMPLPKGVNISTPPAGQPTDAAGNPIGLSQPGAPTGATRSRGQFAESVIPTMEDAKKEIASLGDKLGPSAGRMYDVYVNKAGFNGPEFAGLHTDLHNIATAWMRLHANSEKAREDFVSQLKQSQTPDDLIARLDRIEAQAKHYVGEGQGKPQSGGPTYIYKDGKLVKQ